MSDFQHNANRVINEMRDRSQREIEGRVAHPRNARISSYDPKTPHLVKVVLLPEGDLIDTSESGLGSVPVSNPYETDWIPYHTTAVGKGFGSYFPPSIGDQVQVVYQEHDKDSPMATARIADSNTPVGAVIQSGEYWVKSKSGVTLYMDKDAKWTSAASAGYFWTGDSTWHGKWTHTGDYIATGNLTRTGSETISGNLTVQGVIFANGGITAGGAGILTSGEVTALNGSSNIQLGAHHHSGVTTGGGNTGEPVPNMATPFRGRLKASKGLIRRQGIKKGFMT